MGFAEKVMDTLKKEVEAAGGASVLASGCGVNLPTLTRWLTGVRQPKLIVLGQVMDYLGLTVSPVSASSDTVTCPEIEAEVVRLRAEVRRLELELARREGQVELLKEQLAEAQSSRQAETPAERKAAG